jgi:hypothetical protein
MLYNLHMITIDDLLLELTRSGLDKLGTNVPSRDKKILISLTKQISSGHFLTENQSKLLLKILNENKESVIAISQDFVSSIEYPTWSKPFRVIEQVRKIFLNKEHDSKIVVEFTYNKRLKQIISDLSKQIQGQILSVSSKQYLVPLTEKNIHTVVKTFKNQGFAVDQNIMKFYSEIDEILQNDQQPFDIFKITNDKIINAVKADIGEISQSNLTLLNDRKFKFQYTISEKNSEVSLVNSIANRQSHKVWIDSNTTDLASVVDALTKLNRFPLLFVFNGHEVKECTKNLKLLSTIFKDNVGVYFRFDNTTDHNKEFNSTVSAFNFNKNLNDGTSVAVISNNKLPKFMLKSDWYPASVISFSNNFKSNKTSVYCDSTDLIIYYSNKQPLGGGIDALV